jgi:hypothetical protein
MPKKTGRRLQKDEPPCGSGTENASRQEDAPSRESGTTQERHREEESYSGSWWIPEKTTGHGWQEDNPLRKYGRAQGSQTSGTSAGVTHKST